MVREVSTLTVIMAPTAMIVPLEERAAISARLPWMATVSTLSVTKPHPPKQICGAPALTTPWIEFAGDDGGSGSEYSICSLGEDCTDCGGQRAGVIRTGVTQEKCFAPVSGATRQSNFNGNEYNFAVSGRVSVDVLFWSGDIVNGFIYPWDGG